MKQRTTPPQVSRTFLTKSTLVAAAVVLAGTGSLNSVLTPRAHADQFDDQKAALKGQISQFEDQAKQFEKKITDLQAKLQLLDTQKKQLQAEIKLTQTSYDQLQAQIDATEQKIQQNRDALGYVITRMYIASQVSPLEMLASSKNVGDYLNQQTYQQSMQDSLKLTIAKIESLKKSLEEKQADVESTLDKQKAQEKDLSARAAEERELLARTKGQQATYQKLVDATRQQLQDMSKQQRAYFSGLSGGGVAGVHGEFSYTKWSGNQGCGGGYPYCADQDTMVDPWGLYNRECVSYVAWALQNRFHKYVGNFNGQGNAGEWPVSAIDYSGAKAVETPKPGDAVILPATSDNFAPIGHAMIVESVKGDTVHVSQYNFYGTGEYSTMDISTGGVVFLRFPNAS